MRIYRGVVHDMVGALPVVIVPRVLGDRPFGPIATTVNGLAPDDLVVVADELDGFSDAFVVLGRLEG